MIYKAPENYTGQIELPDNITGRMFVKWYSAQSEIEGKKRNAPENSLLMRNWRGAVALLPWCEIKIEGVLAGDMTEDADNVPLDIIYWLGVVVDHHLGTMMPLKKTLIAQSST